MEENIQVWRLEIYTSGPGEQWYSLPGEHPSLEHAFDAGRELLKGLIQEKRERSRPDEVWVIFPDGRQKQRVLWSRNTS